VIDGLAAILTLTFLWTGWETGSIYQGAQTIVVFMAALIARAVTLPIARFVVSVEGSENPDHVIGAAFIISFLALYGLLWIGIVRLTNEMRNFQQQGPGDRVFGACIGALRGALFSIVLGVGIMNMNYDRTNDVVSESFEKSHVGPVVARNDFLSRFADKLAEDMETEANRDPEPDRAWDVPQ
jgi:uncharacterized membrane protein required for colicin V production